MSALGRLCFRRIIYLAYVVVIGSLLLGSATAAPRERLSLDAGWKFALGHASDRMRDFGFGTSAFVFAKAGRVDGPAAPSFDDRAWQSIDLPHDWAVALPFSAKASTNRGSKAIGSNFPENSIGWYRKTIAVAAGEKGLRFRLEFDGVYRNSKVWVNGFYLGTETSGYNSFSYDITNYLVYGGNNVIVVRVDATDEEGWFYEGAGIYRHVWLEKTSPVHVATRGTFLSTTVAHNKATVFARTTLVNDSAAPVSVQLDEIVRDSGGHIVAHKASTHVNISAKASVTVSSQLLLSNPHLWSPDTPTLYNHEIALIAGTITIDCYVTSFGVRTAEFDSKKGFLLNGVPMKLKGLDLHQDHAGVGMAIPESLEFYRLKRVKELGANAIRIAHHVPSPSLLDAADRLGILVIDENRHFGMYPEALDDLRDMIERDRNHPSVFLWSVGNEEWKLEWDERGTILAREVQQVAHELDPTRRTTIAVSASNAHGKGVSGGTDVMGFNYKSQNDVDGYHKNFPHVPMLMTEEGATYATRGIYVDDPEHGHIKAYDFPKSPTEGSSIEDGWKFVAERPYLAGMFIWSGFDYRGEPTPFGWPSISSQFGMMDTTGAFKDSAYYLKAWWGGVPFVHILPHWNWKGREGQHIPVWAYGNGSEVELFINGKSLGRRVMPKFGHIEWSVPYEPGILEAVAYDGDRVVARDKVETTGTPAAISMELEPRFTQPDPREVFVINVSVLDSQGRNVPTADSDVFFEVTGPARIIGAGNGDPTSHEPDQFGEDQKFASVSDWMATVAPSAQVSANEDDKHWHKLYGWPSYIDALNDNEAMIGGSITPMPALPGWRYKVFAPSLESDEIISINNHQLRTSTDAGGISADIDPELLAGKNSQLTIRFRSTEKAAAVLHDYETNEGVNLVTLRATASAPTWHRRVFNGHAQLLVQATGPGSITIQATSEKISPAQLAITK